MGGKSGEEPPEQSGARKFIGVRFLCANEAYTRMYKNEDGTAYTGRCPKCMKEVRVGIAPHGTSSRFFNYDCGRM
ncbi:MAG: hypothetical protein HUU29_01450 [Planctomycetaceae bacterium]|nr:hypothetical protein [Planctomycetaceae bacterium]